MILEKLRRYIKLLCLIYSLDGKNKAKEIIWNSVNSLKNEIDFFPTVASIVIFSDVTSQIPGIIKK